MKSFESPLELNILKKDLEYEFSKIFFTYHKKIFTPIPYDEKVAWKYCIKSWNQLAQNKPLIIDNKSKLPQNLQIDINNMTLNFFNKYLQAIKNQYNL